MAPVRSLLGGRFRTAVRGALALLCLVPQGGLALAAAPPAYGPQGLPLEQRALTACTPTGSFTNCTRVTYSGGDQTFTVPAGVTAVNARVFGAGGAGSPRAYYTGQYGGGGGGYTTGTLAVTPGQSLTLTVGQGGRLNSTSATYGGGGAGGQGFTAAGAASATGGSGGGMSAVWNGAYGTNPLVVAGGGGGSSPGADATIPAAGGGGGSNGGQDNQPAASGRGGTQSAGGAAATQTSCAAATAGVQYQGGRGAANPQNEGGGGGGGGYYGGGGGACQRGGTLEANGMGGGGSGYNRGTGVTNTQTANGTNSSGNGVGGTSGGRSDAQYTSGSGIGDGGGYSDGGNGEIVLEWVTQVGLSVKKTASPTTYVPGQRLTYTFVVSNAGPAPAVNAAVRDALPSALSGFTWTCASGGTGSGCGAASGTGNIDTTATIAANSSVTYTVTGTVPSSTTGTLSNTATVTRPAAATDPNCGPTCSSTVDTPGRATTGLSVTKTPDKNPYVPGQPLTYTIVVRNDGPSDAVGTSVRDTLPATIRNFSWTCTAAGGGSCGSPASGTGDINTTVDLPAGGQVTYRLTGTVPADATGSLDNRATVTPPGGATDPNCSPSCTSTANPVPPGNQANLVVSKTLLTSPVVPGQQIKWQVKVTNNGPSRARNVVVTDRIPAGVTAASMANDQDGASCAITGGTASCPAVEIPVNGTASWTLTGTLDPDATTTPTNTALVTGGPDPSASTRTAVASPTASPSPQANLTISKTLLTSPVVPGQPVQWRVTVTNNGPSRARNVVVTDQVPPGVTGATMTADTGGANCPITGGTATCPAVEIPAGSSQSWTLTGTLDPDATVTPTNTAVVTGGPDPGATARTAVASPTASPSPQANLTVSKSLLTSPVVPGQPVQWRVTVTNNGPSRARNVVVTDQVPPGVTGATMTADTGGANCPITGGTATCPAVEIPAGSSLSWTLTGTLAQDATVTPTNTVTVTGGPDPTASTHTAVASPSNSPSPQANLTVSKVLLTDPVVPGRQIQWRVTVTNNGPSRARNVVVTDQVPSGVDNPVMTASDGTGCPISGGVATCPAVEIPAGSSQTWTLTGTLASDATSTPVNSVTVTGGPDPSVATHTAVASPTNSPAPQANLTVSKVLLTNPVVPGQRIQWQVTVTNNGPSRAREVVVTDQVPTGVTRAVMTADTDGANCPISGGVATCPAVEIPAGSSQTWTLTGTLAQDATVTPTNTVTVTGGPDPATPTHTAVATPTNPPTPQANLAVSKVLLTNPVVPGQQIQWQVSVTNNGPSRARDVVVTDTVPAGVGNASMTAADGTACPINNGTATCPAVGIPAGSSMTWTLTGTLDANATVTPTNTVTVTGGPDPSTPTHTAVASPTNSPSTQANLTVAKALLTDPVVPGQQIQWRVTVTNNGPSRARDVVVTDTVPAGVTGASMKADADNTPCPINNGTATCPAVEIPAGQTLAWTLTGTLAQNATVTPTNTATVTGGPDPATPTHTAVATPTDSPSPQANLAVSKVLLTDPVVPGQQIQWQVSVTNNGPSRARDVVVTDRVPDGVGGPSMTASDGSVCPITGGTAVCPAVELEVGQTVSYTLSGTLAQDATVTPVNTVVVTGGPDPSTPTHTAVASPTGSPTPQASLTVAKALLTAPVVPGEVIQWRITVTNNGPSRARDVVITDQVPDGVSNAVLQSDADASDCPITGGAAVCPAIGLEVGQTASYTLTATLAPDATVTPTNAVVVTGGPDPATPTHTAVASPTAVPTPQANLSIAKALLTAPVVPGQRIEWRVTVTNHGPSRARNVVVTDTVPAQVNGAGMTSDTDGSTCPVSGGTATCPAVEIPAGGSVSYTVSGTLDPAATGTPVNVAVVTGGPDPTATAHTATAQASETVEPRASLTVSKALLTDPVVPGESIAWRISVTNNGPSLAREVVVSDRIPEGVVGASLSPDATRAACPVTGGTAVCPAVEIPVGGTVTYTLSGTLAQDATVTPVNTAVVTGGPDPSTPTHTAVASPTGSPTPQAKLTVSKVLVTEPVVPGRTVQWRVTVANDGPSRARNVVVTDRVPDGVSGASMASDEDGTACPVANGTATCPAIDLEVGETASYTLSGTLAQDATVTPTNTVVVTGGPDPATPTHTAVASPSGSPEPQADLVVAKVLVTDPVVPGQRIQWRVTVTNNGPSRARNVLVTDRVPAGVDGATMTADDGTTCPIAGGTATCPAVEIAAGETRTWTLTGTLNAGATVTPTNTATVTGGPDPATPTHTAVASPSDGPVQEARLSVSKALLTDPVVPGQRIQWQVTVTNRGPSVARDVMVTDRVPAGVNDATMTADDGTACPITDGTATCPAVGIPVGRTRTWTLTGTLDAGATATPANTATVTGGPDPATPTHTAVASPSVEPVPRAHLTVAKVLVTNPVVPGAPVEWRVTVTNDGPSLARDVVVTDRVPAGVNDATMTADDGAACPIADGTATCPAVEIPVGRTRTWTVRGTLDAGATVTPTNSATVTGGPDPATPTHTAVASPSGSPSAQARLSVAKVLLTDPVVAGQRIQWRVTVTNHGPSLARDVVVTDRVPAGVNDATMTADDGTACPIADGTATCPAVEIPVGRTAGWTLTGTLDAGATAVPVNTVVVTGGPDPDVTDRTAVATPTGPITVRHDLLLTKHATPAAPKAGDRVTYTVTATNRASGTYFGAVVTDDLSGVLDGAVYGLDAHADTGRTDYAAPRLTWTLDLRPGATATLSYTVTVKPATGGATLVNRLSADGSNCPGSGGTGSGAGARRAAVSTSGNCSTTTTVGELPSPSPSPTTRPPLPPTGSGSPKPALLVTVLLLALGGLLVAARRSRR
ncbi:hypothetical protein [Kitasatospora purpeofusca]|uniref:DUF7927 domain-containing protein n=1 Tax=Kitasatospora purpeofusca TaxID=67352 RepID=UPI002A5AD024|nr:hypothetical protein [Kitasatospora purpeofusca]MDY0813139.1 hypothetical protein [Kitasatospora purpeofusca]